MRKTALITGASSGFGLLTTLTLARRGWHVLATMRDMERRQRLQSLASEAGVLSQLEFRQLDVTQPDQIGALAAELGERSQPLHALVNNAGFALPGFTDDVTDAELRDQLETNFFGAAAVTRAFLPQLRKQGFGHIVMVSSISGRMGFPGVGSYNASKFALEGWTEALRLEMKPLGIQVAIIEPGSFETDIWTRNAKLAAGLLDPHSPNAGRITGWRKRIEDPKERADPQRVADRIAAVVENPNPSFRHLVGTDAKLGALLKWLLPWSLVERILLKGSGLAG